jgi:hypothetical protein
MVATRARDLALNTSVGAIVLTEGAPKRYITHFDIAEILAAAQRVGRPVTDPALNLMRGVDVVGTVPGSEQWQADDAGGTIPDCDLDNVAFLAV